MIKIALIITLFSIKSFSDFIEDSYYNVYNDNIRIFKIDDANFLLYGDNGTIMRTIDSCKTWKQDFSGTHAIIIKIIKWGNTIYSLSNENEVLISNDFGETWELNKLNLENKIKNFTLLNDDIIYVDNEGNFFKSSNYDFSLELLEIESLQRVRSLHTFNNKIIYQDANQNLFYFDLIDLDINEINTASIEDPILTKKENQLYIQNSEVILKLNDDFSYQPIDIPKEYLEELDNFTFLSNDLILLKSNVSEKNIKVLKYSGSNLDTLYNNSIEYFNNIHYSHTDISSIDNELLFTNFGKTIVKTSHDLDSIKIISIQPEQTYSRPYIYNKNNIVIRAYHNSKFFTLKSNDYGATFKPSKNILKDGTSYGSLFFIDSSTAIGSHSKAINDNRAFLTRDNFESLEELDISNSRTANFIQKIENDLVFVRTNAQYYKFIISKLNLITFEVEELLEIDSVKGDNFKVYNYNNNNYFVYEALPANNSINILTLNKDFSEILNTKKINNDDYDLFFSNIYCFESLIVIKAYVIDSDFKLEEIYYSYDIETDITNIYSNNNLKFLGYQESIINVSESLLNDTTVRIYQNEQGEVITQLLNFKSIDDGIVMIDTLSESNKQLLHSKSVDDQLHYFYWQNRCFYLPKQPDSLFTSVENNLEGPPVLWLYPPFPNPVKDRLKMRFYSSLIQNIQNLEIELINIGSGKQYNIENFDYIPENGFFGFLEFNIAGYLPGAYILNLKLAGESKSELIIIE